MRRRGSLLFGLAAVTVLVAGPARAQEGIFAGMQAGLDTAFSSVLTKTTFGSGLVTKTETVQVSPALTLNLNALVYPSLRLSAGGVFEFDTISLSAGDDRGSIRSTIVRSRPFFLLRSTNPIFSPGFGYFRREEEARTARQSRVKLINDEYAGYLGWNPTGGPRSDFQLLRTHTFDASRAFQDVTRTFGSLVSHYSYKNLETYYRGSYLDTDNRFERLQTVQASHAGRVSHSGSAIRRRLSWNATYNINYQNLRVSAPAGGEVTLPVTPFAGLSAASDTPATAKLDPNPALMDGNLTAGAGVNLGVPASPLAARARNIGLDLLTPSEVNRILVWVDREVASEIAASFSWDIYTSSDNVAWRREAMVATAPFGPFENRFQIDFPSVTARYVKVVTKPLSPTAPDASRYPDIFVTELQALLRKAASDVGESVAQTRHLVNADARMRLIDPVLLYYEGSYLLNGPDRRGRITDTLSNGFSLTRAFGRIFSAYARAALETGRQSQGDRVATVANATLTVEPTATFRSSLLYNAQDEKVAGLSNERRSLIVQNSAQVYRGVDVLFGFGWNATTGETGEVTNDRLIDVTTTVAPRQRLSLTLSYEGRSTERSGVFTGAPRSNSQRAYAALAFDPVRTLRLVVSEEVFATTGEQTRTSLDLGVNWVPFPDGTLQFSFATNAALRPLEFGKDRGVVASVRWNLSRRSYVDASYQVARNELVQQRTDSRIFSVRVWLFT